MLPATAGGPVRTPLPALGEGVLAGRTPSTQVMCVANSMATRLSRRMRCTSSEPRSRQLVDCGRTQCCQHTVSRAPKASQQEHRDS